MIFTFLCAVLALVDPISFRATSDNRIHFLRDTEFARIQEECIYSFRKYSLFENVLPHREASFLRSLGCEHASCREIAVEQLAAMGAKAVPALVWGMHAKDRNIVNECKKLYDRLMICPDCYGTTLVDCEKWRELGCYCWSRDCEGDHPCTACGGSGDIRYYLDYSGQLYHVNYIEQKK